LSKIGKKPVEVPKEVEVMIDGSSVRTKGPKGNLSFNFNPGIDFTKEDARIIVSVKNKNSVQQKILWGMARAILANMVKGVNEGFSKTLELNGVGFRAALKGQDLELNLGFSHPVFVKAPEGITFKVEKNTITISGIDKQAVGQIAAIIRSKKPVEPYKAKGIKYIDEIVRRKAGKKAVASA